MSTSGTEGPTHRASRQGQSSPARSNGQVTVSPRTGSLVTRKSQNHLTGSPRSRSLLAASPRSKVHTTSSQAQNGHLVMSPVQSKESPSRSQPVNYTTKLQEFCAQVAAPAVVVDQAINVAQRILAPTRPVIIQDDAKIWFACFAYMACVEVRTQAQLSGGPMQDANRNDVEGPDLTVTELLQRSGTSLPELFQHMKTLREAHPITEDCRKNLLSLERKYCITGPLFNKFEKICGDVFEGYLQSSQENGTSDGSSTLEEKKQLCWTLFVFVKSTTMNTHCELVLAFYLLLCCLNYTLSTLPTFLRKPPFDQGDCLDKLCAKYGASLEEVKNVDSMVLQPLLAQISSDGADLDVVKVRNQYLSIYRSEGDINELLFLSHDRHLWRSQQKNAVTSSVDSPRGGSTPGTPRQGCKAGLMTPVRTAMSSLQQLNHSLREVHDRPSPTLIQFFQRCSKDPTSAIESCLATIKEDFIMEFASVLGQDQRSSAYQRFQLAQRLYYHLMELLLKQEEERLSLSDFSSFLHNQGFHKCLLGCALEVVMNTYETKSSLIEQHQTLESVVGFPWILKVLDIQAFDFLKVIESILRSDFKLSRDATQHLQNIEKKIIESIVWETDSSVHNLISSAEVLQPYPVSSSLTGNIQQEMTASAAQLFLSPRPHHAASRNSQSAIPAIRKRRSQSLNFFFKKVRSLSYQRLKDICEKLQIKEALPKIWTCFENCLSNRYNLFKNRHLDQILMCCVYAVCKVLEQEIKFKTIVTVYKSLPHTSPQVYKRVFIQDNEYDTVIGFYNRIFMDAMKMYVMQLGSNRPVLTLSPVPVRVRSPQTGSLAYSLPGRENFFVSPLKEPVFKTPVSPSPSQLTPRSGQLYCFGEGHGSAEKLRTINEAVKLRATQVTPGVKRSQRSLNFDSTDDDRSSNSLSEVLEAKRARPSKNPCKSLFGNSDDEDDKR